MPSHSNVSVNLNVEIDASGSITVFGFDPSGVTNVIVAETTLPVNSLYVAPDLSNNGTESGLIEFWEPATAIGTIVAILTGSIPDNTSEVRKFTKMTKKLVRDLQTVLEGYFDCSGASPFKLGVYTGTEQYYRHIDFGRVALSAYAHYLFGHVAATAAITNDQVFMNAILSKTRDVSGVKYYKFEDVSGIVINNDASLSDANIAVRIVNAIITKDNSKILDIVNQVIGQDASRAMGQDNNELDPDVHQKLRFYAGDVIYINIRLLQPEVSFNQNNYRNYTINQTGLDDLNYTVKITLEDKPGAPLPVVPSPIINYDPSGMIFWEGVATTGITPTNTGGSVDLYSISPDLSAQTGLSFNTSTGMIYGTPTIIIPETQYTITAQGPDSSITYSIRITVLPNWVQKGQDIDGEAAGDRSGESVSMSGDGTTVAIGALYNDGANGTDSGSVRVYRLNGNTWDKIGQDIDGEASGDLSGWSVSLNSDGTILAIGAVNNDGANGTDSGSVRVYRLNGNTWNKIGQDIDGEAFTDYFGSSVSLSSDGTTVAVGATDNKGESMNIGDRRGSVRVYKLISTNGTEIWDKIGQDIDGVASGDRFGYSVSLNNNGTILAISSRLHDGLKGHVKVYELAVVNGSGSWVQKGLDIDGVSSGERFGYSVSLNNDGTILAVGAIYGDETGIDNKGRATVYEWTVVNGNGNWLKKGLDLYGEASWDSFGQSVSLNGTGTILAVGAIYNNNGRGSVRVYKWTVINGSGSWIQKGLDIDGEANDDYSGHSISISDDGTILAIGAPSNDGVNGVNSGHVRVYVMQ